MIEIKNLTKTFEKTKALNDISFNACGSSSLIFFKLFIITWKVPLLLPANIRFLLCMD